MCVDICRFCKAIIERLDGDGTAFCQYPEIEEEGEAPVRYIRLLDGGMNGHMEGEDLDGEEDLDAPVDDHALMGDESDLAAHHMMVRANPLFCGYMCVY